MEDIRTPQINNEQTSVSEPHHIKPLRSFLVVLVIILIAWGLYALFVQRVPAPEEQEQNYTLQVAQDGMLIGSFPKELIPEQDVVISASAELTYTDRTEQLPTAEYVSKKTFTENIDLFKAVLTTQGWTVVKEASATETPVTNFYATKDGNDVNITLFAGETVRVHIAYVKRQ